jgi:transposase
MTQEQTTENKPYYVVITGTNIRSTLHGKDYTPKVYDSEQIARDAIDAENIHRKAMGARTTTPRSPISVDEYDRKYSAYRNIPKE